MSGQIPCSPWTGKNGDLSFSATIYDASGGTANCPQKTLKCNPEVVHLKAGLAPQTEFVDITNAGLTHRSITYKHWLYLTVHLIASSGASSASIGPLTTSKASCAKFCGVGLTLGSSATYGAPFSRYFDIDLYQRSYSLIPSKAPGKSAAPIWGTRIPVSWIGYDDPRDGSGPSLGVYLSRCTNNKAPRTAQYWNYPGNTFFNLLKP